MFDIEEFVLTLDEPLQTARGPIEERRGFLVTVDYGGETGVGEATPLEGWTESYETCRVALDRAGEIAAALDPGIALAKIENPAARHGLSVALADAVSRARKQPLYQYLGGGGPVESVPVNATLDATTTPAESAASARRATDAGFEALKLKVGAKDVEDDIERVRAVRDAVGPDVELRVDANCAWTTAVATTAFEALDALGVSFVEQPLPPSALEDLASLRGGPMAIALDESLARFDVETILDASAADVLVLKPQVLGGPDRTVEAARLANEAGVDVVLSTTIDGVVARTAAVHTAASLPAVEPSGLATADRLRTDLGPDPVRIEGGRASVPQDKGLGLGDQQFG